MKGCDDLTAHQNQDSIQTKHDGGHHNTTTQSQLRIGESIICHVHICYLVELHFLICASLLMMKMPFPCDRDVGFMIHMALGLRRNSSTNKV